MLPLAKAQIPRKDILQTAMVLVFIPPDRFIDHLPANGQSHPRVGAANVSDQGMDRAGHLNTCSKARYILQFRRQPVQGLAAGARSVR